MTRPVNPRWAGWTLLVTLLTLIVSLQVALEPPSSPPLERPSGAGIETFSVGPSKDPVQTLDTGPDLNLSLTISPDQVCVVGDTSCSVGSDLARAMLSASAVGSGTPAWTSVQVLFVLETTIYDGAWDPYTPEAGSPDPCWVAGWYAHQPESPCGESNGVPFFAANAGAVAASVQAVHPFTNVSFGLVDYFHTNDYWDSYEHNSTEYHVDVGRFVPAPQFQPLVDRTLMDGVVNSTYVVRGVNWTTNFLDSSSITALYGSLTGVGLAWSSTAHHVIVWIGSTSPRDPNYVVNYCISPSTYVSQDWFENLTLCLGNATNVTSPRCEPSYAFSPSAVSPDCLGWTQSQTTDPNASVSSVARTTPDCVDSLGGNCTIDTIDLWTMSTDPNSESWVIWPGTINGYNHSSAGSWWAYRDTGRIVGAACDLANATGGTWDGPAISNCGKGRAGTLNWVGLGSYTHPNTTNPTLFSALTDVGFGQPPTRVALRGADRPLFTFVPWGNVRVASPPESTTNCSSSVLVPAGCEGTPSTQFINGREILSWNWSTIPGANFMFVGDRWTAQFEIDVVGPPKGTLVPVDACTLPACTLAGSDSIQEALTDAAYLPQGDEPATQSSFPLAQIFVGGDSYPPITSAPPPPPPAAGPPPGPVLTPVSVPSPVALPAPLAPTIAGISTTAGALGLLAAGFARIAVRSRPIPVRIATVAGPMVGRPPRRSKFDGDAQSENARLSRDG
jgi:hypothetical protein